MCVPITQQPSLAQHLSPKTILSNSERSRLQSNRHSAVLKRSTLIPHNFPLISTTPCQCPELRLVRHAVGIHDIGAVGSKCIGHSTRGSRCVGNHESDGVEGVGCWDDIERPRGCCCAVGGVDRYRPLRRAVSGDGPYNMEKQKSVSMVYLLDRVLGSELEWLTCNR